jgi:large conductance mechanosensitive channel
MLKDFKEFALRGNVVDMAVGVVIGTAFGKIATSLVSDIVMPPIGLLLGEVNFSGLFINLSGRHYATLEQAKAAGVPTINYGAFITTILDFLIVTLAIFFVIRQLHRLFPGAVSSPAKTTMDCPFCLTPVHHKAKRCAHCTSDLAADR